MRLTIFIICVLLVSCKPGKKEFKNDNNALSYYLGIYTGLTLKEAGYTKFNKAKFEQGARETFKQGGLNHDKYREADSILHMFILKGIEKINAQTLEEGKIFLEKNKMRKEVTTAQNGLQYETLREGNGPPVTPNDSLKIRFTGFTTDGQVFISSDQYADPQSILKTIRGCSEALKYMKIGSKHKVYLPTELAFGRNPIPGGIVKPNMAVIFEIEILAQVPKK